MNRKNTVYCLFLLFAVIFFVECTNRNSSKHNSKYTDKYGAVNESIVQNIESDSLVDSDNIKLIGLECNYEYKEAGSLFHHLKLVPLEANSNSLIGDVNKIIVRDSLVYLLDKHRTKSLLVFNLNNGKFIRKIGGLGKSHSEYIDPTDFAVTNNHVVILDNLSKKLLMFDPEGNFKTVVRLQFALQTIERTDIDTVFIGIAGDNRHLDAIHKYRILTFNTHGNILSKHLKMNHAINFSEFNNLKSTSDCFWYHAPFSNDIVLLNNLNTEVKYKFQFSKKGLPDDFVKQCDENYENFVDRYRRSHSYIQDIRYYTKRYIVAQYAAEGRNGCLLVYDRVSDTIFFNGVPTFNPQKGTIEDYIVMRLGWPNPVFTDENDRIYGLIPTENLDILAANKKIKELLDDKTVTNNNPVLFTVDMGESLKP